MGIKCLAGPFSCYKEPPKEFICDTDADFDNLPEACTGSTAISLWSKKERVVNTKGIWRPYGECFVGSPIIDLLTVESEGGGTLEYGKEYQFKEVIAQEDFDEFISKVGGIPEGAPMASYAWFIRTDNSPLAGTPGVLVMRLSQTEPIYIYAIQMSPYIEEGFAAQYYHNVATASGMPGVPPADGWYKQEISSGTLTAIDPPVFTLPSAEEEYKANPDLETLSVFFDIVGTKTVLAVTDTNDEGIVASYEVYADDALVDTVPKAETIDATALGVTAGASVTVKAKSIIDTTSKASNAVIFE